MSSIFRFFDIKIILLELLLISLKYLYGKGIFIVIRDRFIMLGC